MSAPAKRLDPLVAGPGGEGGREGGPDGRLRFVVELGTRQLGTAECAAQVGEELGLDRTDRDPLVVGRLVGAVAGVAARQDVVAGLDVAAERELLVDDEGHEPQDALRDGDVEVGAVPRGGPGGQGGRDGERRLHAAGGGVGDGGAGEGRRTAGPRRAHGQVPAHGEVVDVVPGPLGVRPVLAVPGGGAVDQAGVARRDGVVADAQPFDDAGAKALDDDVRRVGQGEKGVLALGVLEVEQDATHAPLPAVGEERGLDRRCARRGHRTHLDDARPP